MIVESKELVPAAFVASRLCVPVNWLRAEAEAGRLPCLRAGRAILFHVPTVERLLIERAKSATSATLTGGRRP